MWMCAPRVLTTEVFWSRSQRHFITADRWATWFCFTNLTVNIALGRIGTYTLAWDGGKWSDLEPHSWLGKEKAIASNSEYRTTDQSAVLIHRSSVLKLLEKAPCVGSSPRFPVLAESHNTQNCYVLHTCAKIQCPQKLKLEPFQVIKHSCNNGQDRMDFSTKARQDKLPT